MLCTVIDVNEIEQRVYIKNYTDNLLLRAFGRNEHPTFADYEEFLETRCFPRTRDKMKLMLKEYDIPFYDPFLIVEKTGGRMEDDDFHIIIER
jgi:putative transcriptional regulator